MLMVSEKTTAVAMYEQGQLDFIDNRSIPTLEKKRIAKQRGFHQRAATARLLLWLCDRSKTV